MTWWHAALWGLAGGGAASVVSLSAAVVSGGYIWPHRKHGELGPWLFVLVAGLVLGAVVAAAAHDQISGPWPAFIFGVGAPATIRGVLSGVEVEPVPEQSHPMSEELVARTRSASVNPQRAAPEEGEVHEDTH